MKKLFVLTFIVFAITGCPNAFALSGLDAGSINSINVMDLRIHEAVKREENKNAIAPKAKEVAEQKMEEANKASLTDIKYVTFTHNQAISSKELFTVIQSYLNQPMSVQNVSAIRKEIMRYYQKKGFYSAVAMVSAENTQTGELIIDIKEGGKNSITIEP